MVWSPYGCLIYKTLSVAILCTVFVLASGLTLDANAQADKAQSHVAAAKAAAVGPGENFTKTFTAVCKESKPGEQGQPTPAEPANFDDRPIPPRSDWYVEPVKVFDNLFNVGTSFHVWVVKTSAGIILLQTRYLTVIAECMSAQLEWRGKN
jgi:hypothetical protein